MTFSVIGNGSAMRYTGATYRVDAAGALHITSEERGEGLSDGGLHLPRTEPKPVMVYAPGAWRLVEVEHT